MRCSRLCALTFRTGSSEVRGCVSATNIFFAVLFWLAHAVPMKLVASIFDMSLSTFSKCVEPCLAAIITGLSQRTDCAIGFPTSASDIARLEHDFVDCHDDSGRFKFFHGVVGAADGTLIPMHLPRGEEDRVWRTRKGFIGMNALVCVDRSRFIRFLQCGFTGSTHDGTMVAQSALLQRVPEGKYVLFDAGSTPVPHRLLTPFRSSRSGRLRYHLQEFRSDGTGPKNAEELFNLRHSVLRSVVEMAIGVWKLRFEILRRGIPFLDIEKSNQVVIATAYLHNYAISQNTALPTEEDDISPLMPSATARSWFRNATRRTEGHTEGASDEAEDVVVVNRDSRDSPYQQACAWRTAIATEMFADYQTKQRSQAACDKRGIELSRGAEAPFSSQYSAVPRALMAKPGGQTARSGKRRHE
eukprot:m.233059 g.233059  ORF g.233059 m.233059 type:complete len:414 (-) comp22453_c1_seq6:21-1262(-)